LKRQSGPVLSLYRQQPVRLYGVIPEIDIWRAAYLMFRWYGETAQEEGARRADEHEAAGDQAGVAVWHRINDVIEQLANMTPLGPVN
jgi:hypothetical protein